MVSEFLSCPGGDLGLFLEVQQGSQTSLSFVREHSGFHLSREGESFLILN